jgi:hypothetical protein
MEATRFSLLKPNIQTPFHIDFDWWQQNETDWHVHLRSLLCETHQAMYGSVEMGQLIDHVDTVTAEVRQIDGLQHALIAHCAQQEDFLDAHTALVDAVFRVLLANGNSPMNSTELAIRLGKSPEIILKTLSGPRVYKGIRQIHSHS